MKNDKKKEHKKKLKVNTRPILSLLIGLGFFSIIILSMMLSSSPDTRKHNRSKPNRSQASSQEAQGEKAEKDTKLAVVKAIDLDKKKIELYEIDRQMLVQLDYSGGTNITDKYGKIISMSQIELGAMVDVVYLENKNKLTDMSLSNKAWEYVGVSNLTINPETNTMKIAKSKYKFNKDLSTLDGEKFVSVENLAPQDELTIRGFEETIWSIIITKGHGTVVLEDYKIFLDSYITIGYESMQQIKDNMEITVREGNFNLTVDTGKYSATKNITIKRNKVTYVSLGDMGPEAMKQGRVIFEITPFGADLYINDELISYANPIELYYGEYKIKVSLGGYTTYQGILKVDSAGKTIKIDLPESSSSEDATVTETNTGGNDNGNSQGGDNTQPGNSGNNGNQNPSGGDSNEGSGDIDRGHMIYVQKPVGASVYIDGEYRCIAPGNFPKIIGTHVITFIRDGYETMSYTIEVSDDGQDTYFTFPELIKK